MKSSLFLFLFAAAACADSPPAAAPTSTAAPKTAPFAGSLEGAWRLVDLGGVPLFHGEKLNLAFHGTKVEGFGGCNHFDGTAEQAGSTLVLRTAATERGCDLGEQEGAYFRALDQVRSFVIIDGALELRNASGTSLARLTR